jgi:hypothetical protein
MLALTFYDILKFGHVALAVAWVGGALTLSIMAELALRSPLPGQAAEFTRQASVIGQRFFAPVSVALLGLGFWLIYRGNWGYPTWIVVSLVIFGLSFVLGAGFLGPRAAKLAQAIAAEGPDSPAVRAEIRTIVTIARVDLLMLFVVVFLLVTKVGE